MMARGHWPWPSIMSKLSNCLGSNGVVCILLERPFDKESWAVFNWKCPPFFDMTLGHGEWPRVISRTGWNYCALLLEKSVPDSIKSSLRIWDKNWKIMVWIEKLGVIDALREMVTGLSIDYFIAESLLWKNSLQRVHFMQSLINFNVYGHLVTFGRTILCKWLFVQSVLIIITW